MTEPALEIRGLKKSFPRFQLGPLDLTVPRGSIYGLIGPNAAGKTTTIDLILRMGREDAGTIQVFGMDHRTQEVAVKSRIGYVSPDMNYNAWRKVGRLIGFIRKFYPDWDDAYCDDLLARLGIDKGEKIASMSFGTKVKLGLVIALSHKPGLLLLDEPTIGVDAVSKQEIFAELLAAVQDEDRTVLISSHGLADIERFADHIGIIHQGKMLIEGLTNDIVDRYRMVDFIYSNGTRPPLRDGFFVQEHSENRWRGLLDTNENTPELLAKLGATDVSLSPVTLEELFVAMVKER